MMNAELSGWVRAVGAYTTPDEVVWCNGTSQQARLLEARMVRDGDALPLDEQRFPGSYVHRSDPADARAEHMSFVCTDDPADAGPTNHWMSPDRAQASVWRLFAGSMRGRTMYVVPYLLGTPSSRPNRVGVQITDSPYVVANLRILTRMGDVALQHLGPHGRFARLIHSRGHGAPEARITCHLLARRTVWSIGSGYGTHALLSKKAHALRLAGIDAREESWMAEQMAIVGVTAPSGAKHYIAAAFPSGAGKTTLAMLAPTLPGWSIETVSDDVAWLHIGADGRLWAINPEAGFYGGVLGTSSSTNPTAMAMLGTSTLFSDVAMRADGSPWWEGAGPLAPGETLRDWRGRPWTEGDEHAAAHPGARFAVPALHCASIGPGFGAPMGVPISAIVFGGRRAKLTPLVYEARSWTHGVYVGATMVSEVAPSRSSSFGLPRHDPMGMVGACAYNMGDYFGHWLSIGKRLVKPPKIFHVNWFRRSERGELLWPGFGENLRVLKWIVERVEGVPGATPCALGHLPSRDALDLRGLDGASARFDDLFRVDPKAWLSEAERSRTFLGTFDGRLPGALLDEHAGLVRRLRLGLS